MKRLVIALFLTVFTMQNAFCATLTTTESKQIDSGAISNYYLGNDPRYINIVCDSGNKRNAYQIYNTKENMAVLKSRFDVFDEPYRVEAKSNKADYFNKRDVKMFVEVNLNDVFKLNKQASYSNGWIYEISIRKCSGGLQYLLFESPEKRDKAFFEIRKKVYGY